MSGGATQAASEGKLIIGVCNGFQILCESGLLPGALIRNRSLRFVCEEVAVRVETSDSPFHEHLPDRFSILRIPVAHGEGCYYADDDALRESGGHIGRCFCVTSTHKTGSPAARCQSERLALGHRGDLQPGAQRLRFDASP